MNLARALIAVSVLATSFANPSRAAEKLTWYPKLVHRQIGGGYTLALELNRQPKTFFLCGPSKTDCISTKEIGWRKPFIIIRGGSLVGRDYDVVDTTGMRHRESPNYLKTVPVYPAAVAWDKLSSTKALW
ncbi:MAG: hypothetical protein QOK24_736 [Verrucomicrobiota bacterium]|jgi:hypothetical protein